MTARRARILVIDDTPANLMTLCSVLKDEFELQFATSGPSGIALALRNPPNLILLDVMMPEVDGFETFSRLAAQPTLQDIPVIFVTALNDEDSEVTGLSLGAADYITKPINVTIARHRIRNLVERERLRKEVGVQRDLLQGEIARRVKSEERVRHLALHDTLTGLPNRRMLGDRLNQTMAASKRSGLYGALMFLDLDNFKPLNDAQGHEVGDLLLIEVAHRLTDCVREMDTVVRFGGDEFVVMLRELDADKTMSTEQATAVAEKIRLRLAKPYQLTVSLPGRIEHIVEHYCSASIGVVVFNNHEESQADILKWADAAMYQAKGAGRNVVRVH
ncbi:MAG: diguanylate cyclase [Rhodoferax sp.]|uniref:diguanylate cyclase domain-containing protein n=1 Tax=Rhodoferax sp. TaxID=50421 RepID=UPI002618A892|nr:diguanylate cyclase [Rhodoferax sp.]MDD2882658.1 diguanylate cyclase [Rhodoferax sp.]